jgi:hypothetical protein
MEADVATAPLVLLAIVIALLVAGLIHAWRWLLGSLIHAVELAAFLTDVKKEPTWLAASVQPQPVATVATSTSAPAAWSQSDRSLEESWDDGTEDEDDTVDLADEVLLTRLSRLEDEIAEIKEIILRRSGRKT